ncbi:pH-response regulator protein palI/RIM9 isoform X5 [Triticum aestivum]|uniref:pH-response regulator protein palI/RIM9 isoform X5 n=1 Tax=Triticum aestivum TaxID=4565 RepID=UPI001D017D0C|nr:pH-response regulator protein palI/RIM9-like isoform X5 [Triticum aestivum]
MAHLLQPPAHRIGLYYCEFCRDNFPAAHHEADMNGPDTDTQAISNGPPPYDWGEEWEEDGDYYYNGRGRGRGRLRGRGRARGYYGGGRRGGYGYDYGYGGRGGYYEEQGGYFDGEPDEYHPPPGRGRGRGRRMEQSEYYNGEPDEYRPPPGRGKLGLTYHLSVPFACPFLSWLLSSIASQGVAGEDGWSRMNTSTNLMNTPLQAVVVAWEEGEAHGAPEAAGVVRC